MRQLERDVFESRLAIGAETAISRARYSKSNSSGVLRLNLNRTPQAVPSGVPFTINVNGGLQNAIAETTPVE